MPSRRTRWCRVKMRVLVVRRPRRAKSGGRGSQRVRSWHRVDCVRAPTNVCRREHKRALGPTRRGNRGRTHSFGCRCGQGNRQRSGAIVAPTHCRCRRGGSGAEPAHHGPSASGRPQGATRASSPQERNTPKGATRAASPKIQEAGENSGAALP
jgi:hypothetical protein